MDKEQLVLELELLAKVVLLEELSYTVLSSLEELPYMVLSSLEECSDKDTFLDQRHTTQVSSWQVVMMVEGSPKELRVV